MSYDVSAIVSTYKSARFMRGCLEDLLGQTIADRVEIIVIDSASPENEGEIVDEFQRHHRNIRYVRTDDRETVYAAWNRAAEIANGRYLTNANTDDRHRRDALERLLSALEDNPAYAVAYGDCAITTTENQTFTNASVVGHFRWPRFDLHDLFRCCYVGPQPMWRRSLHERHGWFSADMKAAGDYEFWLRLAARGERFFHIPEVLGLYLDSANSIEHANTDLCQVESEVARRRYWRPLWGKRPGASGTYLLPKHPPQPLVTVVVPTRDRMSLLRDALASITAQDYQNWEALVINDGGRETHALETMTKALDAKGRIHCIHHGTPLGPSAARNTALRMARGDIICYLYDDDIYLPHHLSSIVTAMVESGAPFVYTGCETVTETINNGVREIQERRKNAALNREFSRTALQISNYIPINTWGHRRECLSRYGFFDEALSSHEDWDFLLRMSQHWDFEHIPTVTVQVRVRPQTADSVTARARPGLIDIYRIIYSKHRPRAAAAIIRQDRRRLLATLAKRELEDSKPGLKRQLLLYALRAIAWRRASSPSS